MKRKRRKSKKPKRGTHLSDKSITPIYYRSSWELKYAIWLDNEPSVVSYRYEPYSISYVSNKRTKKLRKYWPDFEIAYVDGSRKLVEIKPKRKISNALNTKKFAAAIAVCEYVGMAFVVLTEIELKALGLSLK